MGTVVTFDIRTPGDSRSAVATACAWLHDIDRTFSTYRPDSAISRLGRGELRSDRDDPRVRLVLERCRRLEALTAGAFDLHATGTLDPSGYVKGWALQHASDILTAAGHAVHMVNGGGDVVARGNVSSGGGWRIGIVDPGDRTRIVQVAMLRDSALATSSRAERGQHVPQLHAGDPLDSVSVVADDLGRADAWATAILAGGRSTMRLAAEQPRLELLVVEGSQVLRTPGFPEAA